ncbi:hypothetical protein HMPREF1544_08279 [Mucor circinelloides 1006PhL]|uniref:HTH APSES-type domain-containing protein n=1 Tax=Mucor circinelloides f. circinelloides (strain 1006PhL) TaxID=1220926 RepID=S2JYM2_MUCC1|nr:hypothetical protein HMPREF1544_08279 [Mucor circinelloides 1006PhL]
MPQKATSHVDQKTKQQNDGLPVSIHPDDAKDKVFTAILKALIKMGNKPSSPKELANTIVKHKYATLGGATPFATVSSRISQHFKRAAEHSPPRAPLLAKHVDQHHSRKINYSLATDSASNDDSATETHDDTTTAANTAAAADEQDDKGESSSSKPRKSSKITSTKKLRSRTIMEEQQDDGDNEHDEEEDDDEHVLKKLKHSSRHSTSIHPSQKEPQPSTIAGYSPPQATNDADQGNSDGDLSDYHEEMLKGDDAELDVPIHPGRRFSRRPSTLNRSALNKTSTKSTAISTASKSNSNDTAITNTTITHTTPPSPPTTQESVLPNTSPSSPKNTATTANTTATAAEATATAAATTTAPTPSASSKSLAPPLLDNNNGTRKPSFSFSSGFPGDQELWTPFSFEHDFDNVFLQDASTAHHIPFHIATPESVSVSELDDYFASTSNSTTRTQRKSFSSAMLGPNDKSLLQKVLLASAARGVADKIDEEDEAEPNKKEDKEQESTPPPPPPSPGNASSESSSSKPTAPPILTDTTKTAATTTPSSADKEKAVQVKSETVPKSIQQPISSLSLMDVDNGEDFVKFEDDEKKEPPVTSGPPLPSPINTTLTTPAPAKKVADILPATPTTLSAAEILKSMNIQNLNLSALHQMTSNIPSLQHLSPTFDLAKTMAAYMQSLAKSANANASSSNSPHAMDLKTILARFPALEAFIKKDPAPGTATPPLLSPTTSNAAAAATHHNNTTTTTTSSSSSSTSATPSDFVPNLISGNNSPTTAPSFTAGSTEPIVHTLTTMNPPMYITLIDHIAVCIVVLPKTDTTPEYRIMRRVDTGFINGTVLLTAGGIETESERSMILSFEMERVRMPKKKSQLFGTWIPLRRAQELAVTCSIQHKLGHFLEDSIEPYFPSPLPIQINTRKPARDSRLTALALAALRSETKNNGFIVPPISRQSSSSGSMAAAQLQELLLTHPHKALKSNGMLGNKAPLLGRYDDKDEPVLPAKAAHHHHNSHRNNSSASASSMNSSSGVSEKEDSDVDIVNSSDSSAVSSNEEESDSEADDKSRKSATSASSSQQAQPQQPTINLEDILNRVTPKQLTHIHPRDLQKKRRRSSIVEKDRDEPIPKATKSSHSRKKNSSTSSSGGGGKWSNNKSSASVAIKKSSGGSGTTITIKRPTSSNAAHSSSAAAHASKKSNSSKKEEELDNVVVEHKAESMQPSAKSTTGTTDEDNDEDDGDGNEASKVIKTAASSVAAVNQDDDEDDEDIDIGGSDFDDDLR